MKIKSFILLSICLLQSLAVMSQVKNVISQEKIPDEVRAKQISDMQFGMFNLLVV